MNILSRFYEYTWKRWDSIKFQECGSCIYFCKRKFVWALLLVSIIVNFLFCFLTDVNSHRCCSWPITVASWDIDLFCWFLSVFIWLIIPIFYKPETIHSFPPQNKKKLYQLILAGTVVENLTCGLNCRCAHEEDCWLDFDSKYTLEASHIGQIFPWGEYFWSHK